MHCQSNPIISASSEIKALKNITLKNNTLSNKGRYRAPAKSKTEILVTLLISKKLLTKVGKSSIIDIAGPLDTYSQIKLPKNINRDITKQKSNAIRESLILIPFSVK